MYFLKRFIIIITCVLHVSFVVLAQDNETTIQATGSMAITFGDRNNGTPIHFSFVPPSLTQSWALSISDHVGNVIFTDNGTEWNDNGYEWDNQSEKLYSSIKYSITISCFDANKRLIKSFTDSFFIPIYMQEERTPLIFFDGYTVDISNTIYENNSINTLLTYITNKANNEFVNSRIRIRGHAAFTTSTHERRQEEQIELLDLSRRRALKVLDLLIQSGVDSTRMFYEAYGGSAEITTEETQRWKNRRVEIIFIDDIDTASSSKQNSEDTEILLSSTQDNVYSEEEITEPETSSATSGPIIEMDVEPWPDIPILGKGQLQAPHMVSFLLYYTPTTDEAYIDYVRRIVMLYIVESKREGVNHDVAFAQMILETDYLRFPGIVERAQNNFAGIGAINDSTQGNWFPTEVIGVRAQIQHLKGYATTQPIRGSLVDPRYALLARLGYLGSSPLVSTLAGRWATDPQYGNSILILLRRMYNYANALMYGDY